MKVESPEFTDQDLRNFMAELVGVETLSTIRRLEAGSARLRELGPRVNDDGDPGTDAWNAKEVLAHIAIFSKAYGVIGSRVAKGEMTEMRLVEDVIQKRDVFGEQMSQLPAADLLASALKDQERTLHFLRGVDPLELTRTVSTENGPMSAESLIRLPLVSHLEQHLDQLEILLTD